MPITPLSPLDRGSVTFKADVDTFFGSGLPLFSAQANAAAISIAASQVDVAANAAIAIQKATLAASSATNAASSATAADASATSSATRAAASLTSANNAESSRLSADKRYLGAKASAPTLDNQGAALVNGATYWDTVIGGGSLRVWQTSSWVTIPANSAVSVTNTPAGGITATTVQAALNQLDQAIVIQATDAATRYRHATTLGCFCLIEI